MLPSISGRRQENIQIAISIITPGHIHALAFWVDRNLRKSVRSIKCFNRKHDGRGMNDRAGARECLTAVARRGQHEVVVLAPDCVERPVGSYRAIEAFGGASCR